MDEATQSTDDDVTPADELEALESDLTLADELETAGSPAVETEDDSTALAVELWPQNLQRNDPEVGVVSVPSPTLSIVVSSGEMQKAGRKGMEIGLVNVNPGLPINFLPPSSRFDRPTLQAVASEVENQMLALAKARVDDPSLIGEDKMHAQKLAKEEAERTRRVCFPPSDQQMSVVTPTNLEAAAKQEAGADSAEEEVDAL